MGYLAGFLLGVVAGYKWRQVGESVREVVAAYRAQKQGGSRDD